VNVIVGGSLVSSARSAEGVNGSMPVKTTAASATSRWTMFASKCFSIKNRWLDHVIAMSRWQR
jgi:hypothetical protein